MASLPSIIFLCTILSQTNLTFSQQSYDKTNCSSKSQVPGSNYLCTPQNPQCQAFIAYRAQQGFQTLSSISRLFGLNPHDHDLFTLNRINETESNTSLHLGREIILPINCSCPDRFSRAIITYELSPLDSLEYVACGVFQGMAKAQSVAEENPEVGIGNGDVIDVPIRCACPGDDQRKNGVQYLVTYPVMDHDYVELIEGKFGVPDRSVMEANRLSSSFSAIFPYTTLLIPSMDRPVLNLNVSFSPPSPRGVIAVNNGEKSKNLKNRLVLISVIVVVVIVIVVVVLACLFCLRFCRKKHPRSFRPLSPRSSELSNFTRGGIKHSFVSFSLDELRTATGGFSATSAIGAGVHRARIANSDVAVEEMRSGEAARRVVDILARINHQNIARLEGYCCDDAKNYIVYSLAGNGSLRDCLSLSGGKLTWKIRMQIALDLAIGLHYVHYCIKPAYVHMNINNKTVLISSDYRAKISGFGSAKPVDIREEKEGMVSTKVDVFAFGVVMIELLSGRDTSDECELLDFLRFLSDLGVEGSRGGLERLNEFVDDAMEGGFELADVICLAFLAKACVVDDPRNRPTMNDVLKALSRIA